MRRSGFPRPNRGATVTAQFTPKQLRTGRPLPIAHNASSAWRARVEVSVEARRANYSQRHTVDAILFSVCCCRSENSLLKIEIIAILL
jgi:hypothetical protein